MVRSRLREVTTCVTGTRSVLRLMDAGCAFYALLSLFEGRHFEVNRLLQGPFAQFMSMG